MMVLRTEQSLSPTTHQSSRDAWPFSQPHTAFRMKKTKFRQLKCQHLSPEKGLKVDILPTSLTAGRSRLSTQLTNLLSINFKGSSSPREDLEGVEQS